jgi:hypothetical protein
MRRSAKRVTTEAPAQVDSVDTAAAYNGLVAKAEVVAVHLMRSTFDFHAANANEDSLSLDVLPYEFRAGCVDGVLCTGVRFSLQLKAGRKNVVECFAEYELLYRVPKDLPVSSELARRFAGRNAVFNAWPFFRELAHSMGARTGLPAVVVPLLRLPVQHKEGES